MSGYDFVEYERMKLFQLLYGKRHLSLTLVQKVCRIAIGLKDRMPSSWRTFQRSYLIDIGFTGTESLLLQAALRV